MVLDADADGASVDRKGYDRVLFIATIGVGGITFDASNRIELEVEESDDNSTFTDVADADLVGEVDGVNDGCFGVVNSAALDDAIYTVEYKGSARYARPVLNFVGTHGTGTPISVVAVLGASKYIPAT